MSRWAIYFALLPCAAVAQQPAKPAPKPRAYTATEVATQTITQPDGTTTVLSRRQTVLARFGDGRTCVIQNPASDTPSHPGTKTIEVTDPKARTITVIDPDEHTVTERPMPPVQQAGPIPPAMAAPQPLNRQQEQSSLGTRLIAGVTATGQQTVNTIAAGPNRPAQTNTVEMWRYSQYGLNLLTDRTSSLNGNEMRIEVTSFTPGEPAAGLCAVPKGATIVKATANGLTPVITDMFREAKAGLANVPTQAAPAYLEAIAQAEQQRGARDDAEEDLKTAFAETLQLPLGGWLSDNDAQLVQQARDNDEEEAVRELGLADPAAGLELARAADATGAARVNMYDAVMVAAAMPRRGVAQQDPMALVQECERASGLFPFQGASQLARDQFLPEATRIALIRDGYARAGDAAGQNLDPGYFVEMGQFLQTGHRAEPDLDDAIEQTLVALLTQPPSAGPSNGNQLGPRTVLGQTSRWLALLRQIAPERAQELATEVPASTEAAANAMAASGAGPNGVGFGGRGNPVTVNYQNQMQALHDNPSQAISDAQQLTDAAQQFDKLAQIAVMLSMSYREGPGGKFYAPDLTAAGQAAQAALRAANDSVLQAQWPSGMNLAQALTRLGMRSQAVALVGRCLEAADAQAAQSEIKPEGQDTLVWASQLAMYLSGIDNAYARATLIAPDATRARAEKLDDQLLKPLALAEVAGMWGRQ